jgi:hypothetical protein
MTRRSHHTSVPVLDLFLSSSRPEKRRWGLEVKENVESNS